ncbi:MAG TPA: glycosyltransferase family 39 protein [Intrasporangium sp.]|uniref:glycosyltransferase family 39 protein n=1 Tax=Intrasporangium sp. TaxID=1925024 RepID=UPI002D76860D|nr:glycosyltransferase family 39 protein [Intrasporangium sp.]HET7397161.1 glycosyltransferase family 39 protein [Intrasporangium sp.]
METLTLIDPGTAARGAAPMTRTGATAARPGPAPTPSRLTRFARGPQGDPTWARPGLIALLLATAALYLWGLSASGWANSFYSAAVQAGSESWKAFFYGSSDAASSITVDKPPASLWVMALSVRLLGLSSFSILMPQALMGVATVGVLYTTVKRQFGAAAGLLAGVVMALTPVAALMFRFNNPDALLTLLLTLAAWATMRATEKASARWLALAGVFVGLGFLTKTLQAFLVLPFLGLAYLVAAPTTLRRRITHGALAVGALVVSAGWWVAVVELVPASLRPYVGGSQTNSFLELTFGYNGLGRLTGDETGSVGGGFGGGGTGQWGQTGLLRMFSSSIGDQISWLIPSAFVLLAVALWLRGRMPRTDLRRAAYLVWGGWLLVTMLTFSLMAGIFHEYYTVALAPAVAALVGMGATEAWEQRARSLGTVALAVATAAAAVWGFLLLSRTTAYGNGLRVGVLGVGLAAALLLLALNSLHRKAVGVVVVAALAAALAGPAAYTLSTAATPHSGSIVTAGPAGRAGAGPGGGGRPAGGFGPGAQTGAQPQRAGGVGGLLDASAPNTAVVAALSDNAAAYTWVAAAVGSQSAAGLQLGTQLPVMAIGGFNGSDPSPTLSEFQQLVADGRIHYFAASGRDGGFGSQLGGSSSSAEITAWVQENYTAVTIGGATFYDLTRPAS